MGADSTMYYMKRLQGDEEYPDPPTHEDELTGELSTCKAGLDDCDKGKRGPLQNAFKDSICRLRTACSSPILFKSNNEFRRSK
jgi:hypothetical protein